MTLKIVKANGEKVNFNRGKLISSLSRAGASKQVVGKITTDIEGMLHEGITTKEIYKKAFNQLRITGRASASRYKLKKGIMELGPTGYPFEKYIGELLKHQGYRVQVGVNIKGHCIQHEVDVVAKKGIKHFMIECKFHSSFNIKCNVKIPLYIQSRFLDIQKKWSTDEGHQHKFHQGWVVNNTRFSKDAIQYGNCVGLKLLSWDYPVNAGIKDLVNSSGLYPITCLNTLKKKEKQKLIDQGLVLCKHLCENPTALNKIGIRQNRIKEILVDAEALCNLKLTSRNNGLKK